MAGSGEEDGRSGGASAKPLLDVRTTEAGGVALLHLDGELDLSNAARVREALEAALESEKACVVVDMLGCRFIDSTGLGVLLRAAKRLEEAGGAMAMVCVDAQIRRLLGLTMIDRTIPVFESVDAALAHLGGTATVC